MIEKKIKIVSVSAKKHSRETLIGNCVEQLADVSFDFIASNVNGLASTYNQYLTEEYKDYIIVFIHDDVYVADVDFANKCRQAINAFDVFGVAGGAGGIEITPHTPALWHLISKEKVGFAGHFDNKSELDIELPFNNSCWVTTFGKSPSKANLIDGVLFGVNVEKALNCDLKFDESCPSRFHFYDLLFCVNAKTKGLKLGVFPFNIFHASHGLTEKTNEFTEGDLYFRKHCSGLTKTI